MKGITITLILPGQLRLRAESVKGAPEFARQVQEELSKVPGIREVKADPSNGAMKIKYDRKRIGQQDAINALKEVATRLLPDLDLALIDRYLAG
jgi:copper chaperone CopZ